MVHKIITTCKERRTKENYLDLTLIEILDIEVKFKLPSQIIKHLQRVLIKDAKKAHGLLYGFCLALIFEDYSIPMQVWSLHMTKDILGHLNHVIYPV